MNTDIHALAGAYVLDAVDDLERAAFGRHLAECETCRSEVAEMSEAAARLADGTFSVPPPRLRTDVLTAIGRTRQLPPGSAAQPERDVTAVVSRWRRFTAGAAAAGILAVGAGAATYAIQEQRVHDQQSIVAQAKASAAAARAEQDRVGDILAAPDVLFRTTRMAGGGRMTVAMSASRGAGVVSLTAGSAPPPDKAFQFWTIDGGAPVAGETLAAGAAKSVNIVEGLPGHATFAVTLEPAGGSKTPSATTVATMSLI